MSKRFNKFIAVLLASLLLCNHIFLSDAKATDNDDIDNVDTIDSIKDAATDESLSYGLDRKSIYANYIKNYDEVNSNVESIRVSGNDISSEENDVNYESTYENEQDVITINEENASLDFKVNIKEDGLYSIKMKYYPFENNNRQVEIGLLIDGELPFDESAEFVFNKIWENQTDIVSDSRGNDIKPKQVQKLTWIEKSFVSNSGNYLEPLKFYLSKGEHTITLDCSRAYFAISYIELYEEAPLRTYNEIKKDYDDIDSIEIKDFEEIIQGEHATYKSDPSLTPMYNRSDSALEPYHPSKIKLNTIGQLNWQYPEQWVSWEFDVPEDGFYKIGIKAKQNFVRGLFTSRQLLIDEEIPFKEVEAIKFYFDSHWDVKTLGDDEPYLFHLKKGKHELSLKAVTGDVADSIRNIEDIVYKLNYMYRKMLMITGPEPDKYRDYYLDREIPELLPTFKELKEILYSQKQLLDTLSGQKGSEAVILERLAVQLESFIEDPHTIPIRMNVFKDNISTLSAWMLRLKEQPLEIDYILIQSPDKKIPKAEAGFLSKFTNGFKSFLASFYEDYSTVGEVYDEEEALTVWVGMGRDQVQLIKQMVDDYFTPQTHIQVNVNLVQQGLVQATLAGKGPDVALFIGNSEPVNLAARGALLDLTQFDDFAEVKNRFMESASTPYEYEGGQYALPINQAFLMMFYRKDVFEELGIEPPNTWDELYSIIPVIQRKNMEIGLPAIATSPGAAGTANNSIFDTLLFQNDGMYYSDDKSKTGFDEPEALKAFKQWTEFYTRYKFPMEYDFYSRFRTGEMPLAIDNYVMYNKLAVGAPEIKNLWEMIPIPGTLCADGSINRTSVGAGQSALIFNKTKNKDGAWEFLKWFTSEEMQAEFGVNIEALMGAAARFDTANIEALKKLPWTKKEQEKLLKQWENVKEVPQVPASYYVFRNVYNAFRNVKFHNTNPREALFIYNREMNKEIKRKRTEFGLETDE